MSHLLEGILRLPPALALALVFLLPALEASAFVGVVVPGEIGVILGGVLANQGKLPLWAVLVAGIAGAIIGDSVGYVVGDRYGETRCSSCPGGWSSPSTSAAPSRRSSGSAARPCSSAGSPPRCAHWSRDRRDVRHDLPDLPALERARRRHLGRGLRRPRVPRRQPVPRIEHYANYVGLGLLIAIIGFFVVRRRAARLERR